MSTGTVTKLLFHFDVISHQIKRVIVKSVDPNDEQGAGYLRIVERTRNSVQMLKVTSGGSKMSKMEGANRNRDRGQPIIWPIPPPDCITFWSEVGWGGRVASHVPA